MKLNKLIFLIGTLSVIVPSGANAMGFGKTAGQFLWKNKGAEAGLAAVSLGGAEVYHNKNARSKRNCRTSEI